MKIHSLYNFSFREGHHPQSMQHQERHTGSGKAERSHADRSAKSILVIHGEERKGSQAAIVFCLPWKTCTKLQHPRVNISKAHASPLLPRKHLDLSHGRHSSLLTPVWVATFSEPSHRPLCSCPWWFLFFSMDRY